MLPRYLWPRCGPRCRTRSHSGSRSDGGAWPVSARRSGSQHSAAQERRERDPAEILPLRQLRQLAHDEFKICSAWWAASLPWRPPITNGSGNVSKRSKSVVERGEVGARLIRGAQRQIVSPPRLFQRVHGALIPSRHSCCASRFLK